jgi:hypothetical protein
MSRPTACSAPASTARAARVASASASVALAALLALAVTACGSKAAPPTAATAGAGITIPALTTSLAAPGGTGWAVVEMGGSAAQYNNFWELFSRTAGGTWKLATPPGVASNGGLIAAVTGPGSLLTAFRPSQDLTFSPLALTPDGGAHWTEGNLVGAGLADVPGALAETHGRLLALTQAGAVETSTNEGAAWTRLTTLRALSQTAAARACGLTSLTAAAWTPAGQPLVAGDCSRAGRTGILTLSGGTWRSAAPALPAALRGDRVSVIGLSTGGQRTTAVLAAGSGASTVVIAAWSADGGISWTQSPLLAAGLRTGRASAGSASASTSAPSVSFGADGSVSIVLPVSNASAATTTAASTTGGSSAGRASGAVIGWQGTSWQRLPALPAGTATLATTPAGQPEALAVHRGTLTVWTLSAAGAQSWVVAQAIGVQIPYGSSG